MVIDKIIISNDNTKKYFFKVQDQDKVHIEACLLNLSRYGEIICVSSQIGCSQKCQFCAAGKNKFVRNLSFEEIQEQVHLIIKDNPHLMSTHFQVTYMGSGEPLNNYENVFASIDNLRSRFDNLKKVNISTTCPKKAKKCFSKVEWQKYRDFLHFQYSLHFTQDKERKKFLCPGLMDIEVAINHLNNISQVTNDIYKINYIPFRDLNDDKVCLDELSLLLDATTNAILKISKMCPINSSHLRPSESFNEFCILAKDKLSRVEIFDSDGTDVNAGCGQFYNESLM